MKPTYGLLALLIFTVGCASGTLGTKTNKLRVGMSREQVVETMGGEPESTSANDNTEVLTYKTAFISFERNRAIELVDGKVTRFGNTHDMKRAPASKKRD